MQATKQEILNFKGYFRSITNLEDDLKYFIDTYYTNDTHYLKDAFLQLNSNCLNHPVYSLCDINNSKKVDEEFWVVLVLFRNTGLNVGRLTGLLSYSKNTCPKYGLQNFKKFLYSIFGSNFELVEIFVDCNSNDFILGLSYIQQIYKLHVESVKLKRQQLIFNQKFVLQLDKSIIKHFFGKDSQVKISFTKVFEKILISLKRIISIDKTFRLENLKKLTDLLNKINFVPKPDDKLDFRIEILNLIKKIVEYGQIIEDDSNIQKFFKNNKNHYIQSMTVHRNNWLSDQKTVRSIDYFKIAANYRLEFLVLMGRLAKNELKFDFLDELMDFFVEKENIDEYRDNLLVKFTLKDVEIILNHEKAVWRVGDELKFDDLLQLMGSQVKPNDKYLFHQNTFKKAILATAKSTNDEKLASSITKLIFMHLKSNNAQLDKDVESVLIKLFENISPDNAENDGLIDDVEAIITAKHDIRLDKILIKYLTDLLTDNENDSLRKKSFEILNRNRNLLTQESKNLLENEQLITRKLINLDTILHQLKNGLKINLSYFNIFDFQEAKTVEIITEISNRDLQKIPKSFIRKYLEHIKFPTSKGQPLILIASVLIQAGYVTLADIMSLVLRENINQENILNIIHVAYNYGEQITQEIINKLERIPNKSIFITNLINLITNKGYHVGVGDIMASKKSIDDVYGEFEIKLVYENDLSKRVTYFEELVLSLSKENAKANVDGTIILKSLFNTAVHVNTLNDFINKIKSYDKGTYTNLILNKLTNMNDINEVTVCLEILANLLEDDNVYLRQDIINFLSQHLLVTENEQIRNKINSILRKHQNQNFSKDLNSLLSESEKLIKNKKVVPSNTVDTLISFYERNDFGVEKLSNFMVVLDQYQGLSEVEFKKLIAIIGRKLELLKLNDIITILINSLLEARTYDVPIKIVKEIRNLLVKNNDRERLVLFIRAMSVSEISDDELKQKAIEYLKNQNEITNLRIVSLQYIVNSSSRGDHEFIESLKKLSISKNFDSLSQLAFCSLRKLTCVDYFEPNFLENYSKRLCPNLDNEEENTFVKIFVENRSEKSKYLFLYYLTNALMMQHPIDLSIFFEIPESEWEKEILCNELVFNTMTNQSADEIELKTFRENISLLDKELNVSSDQSIERVLDGLIHKQSIYGLTLSIINEILSILIADKDVINQMLKDFKSFFKNNYWLQFLLKKIKVKWSNDNELKELNEKLKAYSLTTITKLFKKIETKNEKKIQDFLDLLETLENSILSVSEIEEFINYKVGNLVTLDGVKRKFESVYFELVVERALKNLQTTNYELLFSFEKKFKTLFNSKWSLVGLIEILKTIQNEERLNLINNCLEIVHEYGLKEIDRDIKGETLLDNLKNVKIKNIEAIIHNQAIFNSFKGSYSKPFDELLDELITINTNNGFKGIDDLIRNKIKKNYDDVMQKFNKVKQMNEYAITEWCEKIQENPVSQNEITAVVKRGVELTTGFELREIQLLSVLIMLETDGKGRLAQINTGEGKTFTISIIAVIKALSGKTVDIITSSPELAKHQAMQQESFYTMFGLSVSHNCNDGTNSSAYNADILYGTASNFQGDILRDEYSKLGTRNGRKFDIAIVDEVDSMLIDDRNHIVMLSSTTPGMNNLEAIYAAIWIQVNNVSRCVKQIDGKYYYVELEKDPFKDEDCVNPNTGELTAALDDDAKEIAYPIETTIEEFVRTCTETHMRKMLRDTKNLPENQRNIPHDYPLLKYPQYLEDVVLNIQLKKWIDSAISARFRCEKDFQYVISANKIVPIDVANTGVLQQSMQWTDGLHQFLQLKHGAKIIPESFATNFISNVTFFRRYGKNIFGLTGTLGSMATQKLLEGIYDLDCIIIPPFKKKQHKELKEIICHNKEDWCKSIVRSCLSKLKNKRAVLLLTKYIHEAEEIATLLCEKCNYPQGKVKLYKTSDDSHVVKEKINPGEIIIATNIAGRGTDIIPSEQVELNGGLHVCLTFLPLNSRVELQNIGRTSRTGNKGTSQFVILQENNTAEFSVVKAERDLEEASSLKNALVEIEKVTSKDRVFEKFCKLLGEIKEYFKDLEEKFVKYKLMAVEERFSIWLKRVEMSIEKKNKEELMNEYMKFEHQIKADMKCHSLVKNPYFYILSGNEYLYDNDYEAAIDEYTQAINLGENFVSNAYYNRGYAYLCKCDGNYEKLDPAIRDFEKALKIINQDLEPMLHLIQTCSHSEVLSEQLSHKLTLFGIQKNAIENALGIGYGKVDKEIEDLEQQKVNSKLNEEQKKQINLQIEYLKENKNVREKGVFRTARNKELDVVVERIDLKASLPGEEDVKLYIDEIDEFKRNGSIGTFYISEQKPIDWIAVVSLVVIGLAQIVIGGAVAVFSAGAGSTVGIGLIMEGISDIITAIVDARNFSWKNWGIQKAISLTVSIVCAGLGAIKDAAKTVCAGVKCASKVMTTTVKAGWRLACKAIGVTIAKKVAHTMVNQLVDYGLNKTLVPLLEEEIFNRIKKPIQDALETNKNFICLYEIDVANRNNYFCNLVIQKALDILNPKNDEDGAFSKIAKGIINGIAQAKISGLSEAMKVKAALEGLAELSEFVPIFIKKLEKEIDAIRKEADKEKSEAKISRISTEAQRIRLNEEEVLAEPHTDSNDEIIFASNFKSDDYNKRDIDLGKLQIQDEQVQFKTNNKSVNDVSDKISDKVSGKMCSILQNKIIQPTANTCVDYGMKNITKTIDESLNESLQNYQAERRIEFFQDGDRNNRIGNEFKKGMKNDQAVKKADEIIDSVKKGSPLGLHHLGDMSEAVDRPIRVYDEKGDLVRIVGEHRGGQPVDVQFIKPDKPGEVGHWIPKGENKTWQLDATEGGGGKNNCLPDAIAKLTGQNPNTIRNNLVNVMVKNKANLANQVVDIQRLEVYNRKALTIGGYRLDENENIRIELRINKKDHDDIALLNKALEEKKRGGEETRELFVEDIELAEAKDLPLKEFDGSKKKEKSNYSYHHLIPNQEIELLLSDLTKKIKQLRASNTVEAKVELGECVAQLEYHLNKSHIKNVLVNKLHDRSNHGNLILGAFDWNPYNLFHGPESTFRKKDPHNGKNLKVNSTNNTQVGHDTEFLPFQSPEYQKSYQNYVGDKCLKTFSDLTKNKATPMQKIGEKFALPEKKDPS